MGQSNHSQNFPIPPLSSDRIFARDEKRVGMTPLSVDDSDSVSPRNGHFAEFALLNIAIAVCRDS
jgi:hypothetical protein